MPDTTRPAADVDPDFALELPTLLRPQAGSGDDFQVVLQGAATYAARTLAPALVPIAFHLRETGAVPIGDDWTITVLPGEDPARSDLLLEQHGAPGAYHVRLTHRRELTEAGLAAYRKMESERFEAEQDLHEGERANRLMTRILDGDPEADAIEADPTTRAAATPESGLERFAVTALDAGGAPEWAESTGDGGTHLGAGPDSDIWWPGMIMTWRPRTDLEVEPSRRNEPVTDLQVLALLGRAARATGHDSHIAAENISLGTSEWQQYGDDEHCQLIEAGMAIIQGSAGAVDDLALGRLGQAAARFAARDLAGALSSIEALAETLEDAGKTDPDTTFDCNDMDDHAHVTRDGETPVIHYRGQNGTFDIAVDDTGVRITRTDGTPHLVGAFDLTDEGLTPTPEHLEDVPFSLRAVRELNTALLGLDTVACCAETELGRAETPEP